jgi:hypothetical protein
MGLTGASVTPIHGLKEKIEEKRRAAELAEMRASFGADDDDDPEVEECCPCCGPSRLKPHVYREADGWWVETRSYDNLGPFEAESEAVLALAESEE